MLLCRLNAPICRSVNVVTTDVDAFPSSSRVPAMSRSRSASPCSRSERLADG